MTTDFANGTSPESAWRCRSVCVAAWLFHPGVHALLGAAGLAVALSYAARMTMDTAVMLVFCSAYLLVALAVMRHRWISMPRTLRIDESGVTISTGRSDLVLGDAGTPFWWREVGRIRTGHVQIAVETPSGSSHTLEENYWECEPGELVAALTRSWSEARRE